MRAGRWRNFRHQLPFNRGASSPLEHPSPTYADLARPLIRGRRKIVGRVHPLPLHQGVGDFDNRRLPDRLAMESFLICRAWQVIKIARVLRCCRPW
jgi:hypothetical protein